MNKVFVLTLLSFSLLGFWCTAFAGPLEGVASASKMAGSGDSGSSYFCFPSFGSRFELAVTPTKISDFSGAGNSGAFVESFVFSPMDGLSVQPDRLSGRNRQSLLKVQLHILNSVLIL